MLLDLKPLKQGRDILLGFKNDVGAFLHKALNDDSDGEVLHLTKAAT